MALDKFEANSSASFGEVFLQFYQRQKRIEHDEKLQLLKHENLRKRQEIEQRKQKLHSSLTKRAAADKSQNCVLEARRAINARYARPPILPGPPLPLCLQKSIPAGQAKSPVKVQGNLGSTKVKPRSQLSNAASLQRFASPLPERDLQCSPAKLDKSFSVSSPIVTKAELVADGTLEADIALTGSKVFKSEGEYVEFRRRWFWSGGSNEEDRTDNSSSPDVESDTKAVACNDINKAATDKCEDGYEDFIAANLQSIDDSKRKIRQKTFKSFYKKKALYNRYSQQRHDLNFGLEGAPTQEERSSFRSASSILAPQIQPDPLSSQVSVKKHMPKVASKSVADFPNTVSTTSAVTVERQRLDADWAPLSLSCLAQHRRVFCPSNSPSGKEFQSLNFQLKSSAERILFWKKD